jgi:coenzyme F420 hydrogenase subunit beta
MRLKVLDIQDVAERHLCCGCGACAYLCPDAIEMVDTLDQGRRPRVVRPIGEADRAAMLDVCPGLGLGHDRKTARRLRGDAVGRAWGPVLAVWEGHAADEAIRFRGSSGGAASALAQWALDRAGMHGVLHVAARRDAPYLNETVLSTTREELLERTGSRYAPASPVEGLGLVEEAPAPCVFIGKPCDVAAVAAARRIRPRLDRNLGLTIAIFCAGTPTLAGTFEMLRRMGIDDPSSIVALRYRGRGWPGRATATVGVGDRTEERSLSYEDAWGDILASHAQWRCRVCADHSGELADVSVGDPWHRPVAPGEPGRSLIVARTERGRRIVEDAVADGHLLVERVSPDLIAESQPELLKARGAVWGRRLGSRLLGLPAPRFEGMALWRLWVGGLTLTEKLRSIVGTLRRIIRRRLYRREPVVPLSSKCGARTHRATAEAA